MKEQRIDYFLVIDEAHMLLQHIGSFEITKEFDRVAITSATADDIKHFACFNERYNQNIVANKLISNVDEQ